MREFAGNFSRRAEKLTFGIAEISIISGTCNEIPYSTSREFLLRMQGNRGRMVRKQQARKHGIFVFLHYRRQTAASMIEINRLCRSHAESGTFMPSVRPILNLIDNRIFEGQLRGSPL